MPACLKPSGGARAFCPSGGRQFGRHEALGRQAPSATTFDGTSGGGCVGPSEGYNSAKACTGGDGHEWR